MFAIKLKDGRLTSNYNKKRAAIFKIDNSKKELLEKIQKDLELDGSLLQALVTSL